MTDKVLIVDDSLTVRMDLAQAFEETGFEPLNCATAAEARAALAKEKVALVILDILLPDGDGLDLLREIRTTPLSDAPILLLSSEAEVKDRIRGLKVGADDYIGKPYDVRYVIARARELTHSQQATSSREQPLVLVVDDSPTFRGELQHALQLSGYSVVTATNGEEGLHIAAARHPTAILVDSVMTGIDGATFIRRIRLDAALRGTPCVMLTASEGDGVELRALDAGADAFVRKEEDLDVILARLAAVLRSAGSERGDAASLLGPKRVLAVDDSPTYLNGLGDMLRGEGYDVVLARSGEQAIEMLSVQSFDCILLDLLMPGVDGNETCRRVKASPVVRDIPLIMLTAREDRGAMIDGLGSGADDFISKSSDFEVLKARVRAQLRRKQFEDEHRKVRDKLLHSEVAIAEERAARNIVELKAAMVEELERKNRELEAFSYSVSHDLRAPLRTIDGFSQAILDDCAETLNDEGRHHLRRVRVAAQRMAELIDDLLELSRVGRVGLSRREVNLSEISRAIADELRRKEPERNVEFVIPDDLVADADPGLVRIVLENLLGNAWKFTSKVAVARIEVGTRESRSVAAYFVRDNGAGFDMAFVTKLFSPFQRLHSEADFPGTGIGLATIYRIAERHGGSAWAESAVGQGATIFFTLLKGRANGAMQRTL
jgi:DNA-binding response OmpR family regulator